MSFERQPLIGSQQLLNTTDSILDSLDDLILKTKNINVTEPKLFIRSINVTDSVLGAMITSTKNTSFNYFEITELTSAEQLENKNFEIAFLVPPTFARSHYYITLFYNDYLFNQNESATVGSWILNILIPESTNDANSTIQIYFKEFDKYTQQLCQYWKYGNDENNIAISGRWHFDSVGKKFKEGFYICEVNHTTHFGMLVSDTVPDNFILDLVTIFNSILSVIGVSVIVLTAVFFKKWRNETSKKIVINVSMCLLFLMVLLFISDHANNGPICILVGILLHYMVIAQFCWSLAVSYCSYRKYYRIFNNITRILEFCIFSWGVPLIVVSITSAINVETYNKLLPDQICYPKGIYLKLGVCLPMGIILTVNLIVYVAIIKNLTATSYSIQKHVTKKSFAKQKFLILLFFMMGMTWIFGFLVVFTDNVVLLYIFCTTAPLHGFVIFIFYIVDSTEVSTKWKHLFYTLIPRRETQQLTSRSQSTDLTESKI
ncbi:putative G-protein coupled receptor 112-like Protein [Tribolium castaneum]|uniref:Putative G-protein coupled receptor 112-like Protein n=1 Tax=Tribolium castaneum TaxID=7070 RepID=A0A139WHY3_TRICA|nr:PREDICTED: adhesion G-protein coupled receptor G2 isoform X1 [Tribolium castaneum]KYB27610.1 putative G-protein coupled receptor 112-like Protein [Tribolium castaneum]|eukprot:XP_008193145.1 PREDICTED: adhesion G-protein coupled receptor G2 isoform X1 [Tribolium castaneum]